MVGAIKVSQGIDSMDTKKRRRTMAAIGLGDIAVTDLPCSRAEMNSMNAIETVVSVIKMATETHIISVKER